MIRYVVYEDQGGYWRWRLIAGNGKTIADSGEGYASEYNAVRAAARTKELAPVAPVMRLDGTVLNESRSYNSPDPF